jgi:hypothetical protein
MQDAYSPKINTLHKIVSAGNLVIGADIDLGTIVQAGSGGSPWLELNSNPDGGSVSPVVGPQNCVELNDQSYIESVSIYSNYADGLLMEAPVSVAILAVKADTWQPVAPPVSPQGLAVYYTIVNLNSDAISQTQLPKIGFTGLGNEIKGYRLYMWVQSVVLNTNIIDTSLDGLPVWFDFRVQLRHSYPLMPALPV